MRPGESSRILELLGEPSETASLNPDYLEELHQTFGTEMDLLVGKGALERPYGQKPLTAAERFYEGRLEGTTSQDFMEVNRTTMNLWLLDKVMEGDKASFTGCQPDAIKLTDEQFDDLQRFVQQTLPTEDMRHAARVVLMIADMGKSKNVVDRMQALSGHTYADHDRLLVDVLRHPQAASEMTPSFVQLDQELQQRIVETLETGFHLPQFMQSENLPAHLVPFQHLEAEWQDFSHLISIFDIAGAAGDTVQNGSITLNRNTFTSFDQALQALAYRTIGESPQQRAVNSYNHYLQSLGDVFDLDITQPEDRAVARLGRMSRAHAGSAGQLAELRTVLNERLGPVSRAELLKFLNFTGFEAGATWQEYAPALPNEALKSMTKAGISREDALVSALTNIARVHTEAQAQLDLGASTYPVNVVIGDIVRAAEKDPQLLLNGEISIERINDHEARATIQPMPDVNLDPLPELECLAAAFPTGEQIVGRTLFVSFGSGEQLMSAVIAAKLMNDDTAPIISVCRSPLPPANAEHIGGSAYALPQEKGAMGSDDFGASLGAMGLRRYVVCGSTSAALPDNLQRIADHAGGMNQAVSVGVGGHLLAHSPGDRTRTKGVIASLSAIDRTFNTGRSFVFAPSANLPRGAEYMPTAGAAKYNLRRNAQFIIDLCARNPDQLSSNLAMMLVAINERYNLEELPSAYSSAQLSPFRVVKPSMGQVLVMSAADHYAAIVPQSSSKNA